MQCGVWPQQYNMYNIINISDLQPHPLSLNSDQDSDVTEVDPEESDFNYAVYAHLSSDSGCWVLSEFVSCRLAPRIGFSTFFFFNPSKLWFMRITVDRDKIHGRFKGWCHCWCAHFIPVWDIAAVLCREQRCVLLVWNDSDRLQYINEGPLEFTCGSDAASGGIDSDPVRGADITGWNSAALQLPSSSEPCESRWRLQREDCLNPGFMAESAAMNPDSSARVSRPQEVRKPRLTVVNSCRSKWARLQNSKTCMYVEFHQSGWHTCCHSHPFLLFKPVLRNRFVDCSPHFTHLEQWNILWNVFLDP